MGKGIGVIVLVAGAGLAAIAGTVWWLATRSSLRSRVAALTGDAASGEASATRAHHSNKVHLNSHERRQRGPATT